MKLLNTVDASKVIGGTAPVCETSFDTVTVGAGLTTCQQITKCTDKHGEVSYKAQPATGKCPL
ncbi:MULTISPECIES: DUF4762 family protein [Providencia]|uniref:DUF4762 family protein n=1 Tax=Providencia TaxID=586 RepID=UPI00141A01A7|nr:MULTISPECIES: DUF4762 family protein [Providencia]EJD6398731.1 DUF4762 family protein [Providencia rettgeri]EJD6584211.1 DUF4762 family protein [Providencia rettgeri]EJD6612476.1 DUF4762 family protein [Providencia rettgeri]ELL9148545.1 DUF4762 family protein [Providencia rettgeri]ELR5055554.1 DUF4762 family protein [Providencia rettgeri]